MDKIANKLIECNFDLEEILAQVTEIRGKKQFAIICQRTIIISEISLRSEINAAIEKVENCRKEGIPVAGRKPKPTASKKLEGNPGKRK